MKLKNKEIIYLLETAKSIYINNGLHLGMCYSISNAYSKIYNKALCYEDIKYIIPKFNIEFLNGTLWMFNYWWHITDCKSRINAFNKLIKYYKHNTISYKIKFYFKLYCYKCYKIIK